MPDPEIVVSRDGPLSNAFKRFWTLSNANTSTVYWKITLPLSPSSSPHLEISRSEIRVYELLGCTKLGLSKLQQFPYQICWSSPHRLKKVRSSENICKAISIIRWKTSTIGSPNRSEALLGDLLVLRDSNRSVCGFGRNFTMKISLVGFRFFTSLCLLNTVFNTPCLATNCCWQHSLPAICRNPRVLLNRPKSLWFSVNSKLFNWPQFYAIFAFFKQLKLRWLTTDLQSIGTFHPFDPNNFKVPRWSFYLILLDERFLFPLSAFLVPTICLQQALVCNSEDFLRIRS